MGHFGFLELCSSIKTRGGSSNSELPLFLFFELEQGSGISGFRIPHLQWMVGCRFLEVGLSEWKSGG